MISLSLLATPHPIIFQHYPVRTSNWCYPTFILDMARSPGFGSTLSDYRPIKTRFLYGSLLSVNLATKSNSLTHYTKGTQSHVIHAPTACTQTVSESISLPSPGFFSPFPHGTSSLSVSSSYLALDDGPPFFNQDYSCPSLLLSMLSSSSTLRIRDFHPLRLAFPDYSTRINHNPYRLLPFRSPLLRESLLISFPLGT